MTSVGSNEDKYGIMYAFCFIEDYISFENVLLLTYQADESW